MATATLLCILMVFVITINGGTTQTPSTTYFMNYTVRYEEKDMSICVPTTVAVPEVTTYLTITATTTKTTTSTTTTTTTTTTSTTTTSTTTTSVVSFTMSTTTSPVFFTTCANNTMGASCNMSANPCTLTQPCLNSATCHPNSSIPRGYECECASAYYTGVNCEEDAHVCQANSTCLYGGTCNETATSLSCSCPEGKSGEYCQWQVNLCANITCENNGKCISTYDTWSCLCINTQFYSGRFCEIKSSGLRLKQTVSRSFSGVAIGCISTVVGFILVMDILKYAFNMDLTSNDFRGRRDKNKLSRRTRKRKKNVQKRPRVIERVYYIS